MKSRCSRFSATKNHRIRTCRFMCLPHLSSSPDLRLLSVPTAFSAFANDRLSSLWGHLHAYSGGTVRDSHPIRYSPAAAMTTAAGTQREYSLVYVRITLKIVFVNHRGTKIGDQDSPLPRIIISRHRMGPTAPVGSRPNCRCMARTEAAVAVPKYPVTGTVGMALSSWAIRCKLR